MDPPVTASVEQAFRPAFDEIQRRKGEVTNHKSLETSYFARGENPCQLPFHIPDQNYVLMTMGTAVLAPRPLYTERPAARIYGAFPTKEDAIEHSELVKERDPKCSLVVVRRDDWILFPINDKVRDDSDVAQRRIDEKLNAYHAKRKEERIEFERAVNEHRGGGGPSDASRKVFETEDPMEEEEMTDAERTVYAPPKRLRAGAEVRGQASAVVSVVPDEFGEILLRVLGCFESTSEADTWCRDVGSRTVTEYDLFVVPTCDWFYPNGEGKCSTNERYRIGELQRIMDAAKKNPQDVKDYKAWKKEQERLALEKEERKKEEESLALEETKEANEKEEHDEDEGMSV